MATVTLLTVVPLLSVRALTESALGSCPGHRRPASRLQLSNGVRISARSCPSTAPSNLQPAGRRRSRPNAQEVRTKTCRAGRLETRAAGVEVGQLSLGYSRPVVGMP